MDISFAGLLWWGIAIVSVALAILVIGIPAIGYLTKESDTKTEFYSTRAAYWCVVAGLVLIVIAGLGGTVAHVIITVRGK